MKPVSALTQQIKNLDKLPPQKAVDITINIPEIVEIDSNKKWALDILSAPSKNNEAARKWAEMMLKK